MIVTFDNLLDGSELDFKKEVFFDDRAEIEEVIRAAEEMLDKFDLDCLCFDFRGGWYLIEKEKNNE